MPTPDKFTPEARAFVAREKASGSSHHAIAKGLKAMGIDVSRQAIDKYVAKTGLASPPTAPKNLGFSEDENIKATIRALQHKLFHTPLTPREMASASKELRMCFAQLRAAKMASQPAANSAAAHDPKKTDFLIQKLRKWAGENAPEPEPIETEDGEVSSAAGS